MGSFTDRTGEIHITKEGDKVKIIEYFGSQNCTIQFEDSIILKNKSYIRVRRGEIIKPLNRIDEVHVNNQGCEFKIIRYSNNKNCDIEFEDGYIMENIRYSNAIRGEVKNPFYPSVEGIGYTGVGIYETTVNGKITIGYSRWSNLLERCYNKELKEGHPCYKDVMVCDEWKCYQNFAEWFYKNYNPKTMKGWELDKDIFSTGVKTYSPNTCCIIPKRLNVLFKTLSIKSKSGYTGVVKVGKNRYEARISKDKKSSYVATYPTAIEASIGYNLARDNEIYKVIEEYKESLDPKVYNFLLNYKSSQ